MVEQLSPESAGRRPAPACPRVELVISRHVPLSSASGFPLAGLYPKAGNGVPRACLKPWVGINAEVARGIKERANGRRLLRYDIHRGTNRPEILEGERSDGLLSGDGFGRRRRAAFYGHCASLAACYKVIGVIGCVRSTRYLPTILLKQLLS